MSDRPERPLGRLLGGLMPRGAEDFFDRHHHLAGDDPVLDHRDLPVLEDLPGLDQHPRSRCTAWGFKLWPRETTFEAYGSVFSRNTIGIAYLNTILRTVAGTTLAGSIAHGAGHGRPAPGTCQRAPADPIERGRADVFVDPAGCGMVA